MADESPQFQYEEIRPLSREELERSFATGTEAEISYALFAAVQHDPDWRWAQNKAVECLTHPSLVVRRAAVNSLGELAVFRRVTDHEIVIPALHALRNDPTIASDIEMALDEIRSYVATQ